MRAILACATLSMIALTLSCDDDSDDDVSGTCPAGPQSPIGQSCQDEGLQCQYGYDPIECGGITVMCRGGVWIEVEHTDPSAACFDAGLDADADAGVDGGVDAADLTDEDMSPSNGTVLLGEGGFFGVSGRPVGELVGTVAGSFAIGAHYADISDGVGDAKPAGRVYIFDNGSFPSSVEDATLVLEPPDGSLGGGFGWYIANACDFNKDGHLDLAVGNHLHSESGAPNSGRAVVFWGEESGLTGSDFSYHSLSTAIRAQADALGQTVLCADFNGDDYDDLLASGQNGGPDDTGIAAIYYGSETGLAEYQDAALYPTHVVNRQYFGSASLWADLDGDGAEDLAIGGWGLVKGDLDTGPHTGGVVVFSGGDDWSAGPSYGVFPSEDAQVQLGSNAIVFDSPSTRFLAATAPDYGETQTGAVFVWETGFDGFEADPPLHVLLPPGNVADTGFGGSVAFVPDYFGVDQGALLVGMKYADASETRTGTGLVAVFALSADGESFETTPTVLQAPDPQSNDAFGGRIAPLDDVNGDGTLDFFVGMESHIEGDIMTGTQTGGVVFY